MDPNGAIEAVNGEVSEALRIFIENWLTILFGVVSLVGVVFGYVSWKSGSKNKKVYGYLFELAEKSLDKEETERTLAQRKKEVDIMSERITALQERIREDIPKEAQRAVLKDRFDSEVTFLRQLYGSATEIGQKLSAMGESAEIPPEIRKFIEREISPEYMLREKRSNLKTYLSVIMAGAAILPAIIPGELGWIGGWLLLLVGMIVAMILFASLPIGLRLRRKLLGIFRRLKKEVDNKSE